MIGIIVMTINALMVFVLTRRLWLSKQTWTFGWHCSVWATLGKGDSQLFSNILDKASKCKCGEKGGGFVEDVLSHVPWPLRGWSREAIITSTMLSYRALGYKYKAHISALLTSTMLSYWALEYKYKAHVSTLLISTTHITPRCKAIICFLCHQLYVSWMPVCLPT